MTIKDLRARTGLTQREFAEHFGIPRRTIENWEAGVNQPPQYVISLLEIAIEKEEQNGNQES